jgi:hypothetical protein
MPSARILLAISVLTACGSSHDAPSPDSGTADKCSDMTTSSTVMVSRDSTGAIRAWSLDAASGTGSVLVHAGDASNAIHVAFVQASGLTELAVIAGASGYEFATAPLPATSCAVATSSKAGIAYACAGQAAETASIDALDAGHPPVPFQSDGTLFVFAQSYAAFTEIDRSPSGQWSQIEQFESSISYPTDVAATGGEPLVCFISSADRAVLKLGDQRLTSSTQASWCKLAIDGGTVHVITDAGYAAIPLSQLTAGGQPGMFDVTPDALTSPAQRLIVAGGNAFALVYASGTLSSVQLPSGPTTTLAATTDSSAVVGWDEPTGAALLVSSNLDTTGSGPDYPQTFTFHASCMH